MLTATVDMSVFNAGMRGLITKCRISAPVVVKKEAGELIKELVRVSPPKEPKKTKGQIEASIIGKFSMVEHGGFRDYEKTSGKVGHSGIKWYSADEQYLRGVQQQADMRKADAETIYRIYRKLTPKGRYKLPFRFPRKRQQVLISMKTLTKRSTVQKVIRRVSGHVGRLKAAWLVASSQGPITLSGAKMPPQWVTKHTQGARGRFENGLSVPDKPTFTIANFAKGITQRGIDFAVQLAVKSRAASMATNTRLILAGKKRLADYA